MAQGSVGGGVGRGAERRDDAHGAVGADLDVEVVVLPPGGAEAGRLVGVTVTAALQEEFGAFFVARSFFMSWIRRATNSSVLNF